MSTRVSRTSRGLSRFNLFNKTATGATAAAIPLTAANPLTATKTTRASTAARTTRANTARNINKVVNKELPKSLPKGSITVRRTAKRVNSGIFKLKSNLPGKTRKKPKLLTEMIFRSIFNLRAETLYWIKYVDEQIKKYTALPKENPDDVEKLKIAERQLFINGIKRSIAIVTYQWAIVKKVIFNKKSISLDDLNGAISELSDGLIPNYSEVSVNFKELLTNYENLVTGHAGEEFTIDSDMRKLKIKISDLILVNDLGKKQVERLLGVAAAAVAADQEEVDAAAAAAEAEAETYDKTLSNSAYDKVGCKYEGDNGYNAEDIKQLEKLDPIDRLIDICNTPYMGDNLNLEALRRLDINFKNRRDIHTRNMCLLASLKDDLLKTGITKILIKARNKINTDGSLGERGRYRNLDVDAFFRQPNLPFLSIAAYCIMLTHNQEIDGTRKGYFHMGEPYEVKVSGPEAKEQLVTIYEFTKEFLVSGCHWNRHLLDSGITPRQSRHSFPSNNYRSNILMILCPMLSNVYNMIHLFRTSKKVEKNATYVIGDPPAPAPARPGFFQRFNPFAPRAGAAPVQGLRIQIPVNPPHPGGGATPPGDPPHVWLTPSPTPPPSPPGSPPVSPPGGPQQQPQQQPQQPQQQPQQPAGAPNRDIRVSIVDRIKQYRPDKPGGGNIDTVKQGFTLITDNYRRSREDIRIFILHGVPKMVVEILTFKQDDLELDNISCNLLFTITLIAEGINACFDANVERLLVEVINRTIPRKNNKDMTHNIFVKAITVLRRMAGQNIDALRNAGVSDAIFAVKGADRTVPEKSINDLLNVLDYNDDGSNRRAPPPKRTALGVLRGLVGMHRAGGSRKKSKVRKAMTRRR